MFNGFNLITDEKFLSYKERGYAIYNGHRQSVENELNKFILDDGSINGSELQEDWFPQINADIFISHSHADEEKAIALAGWLNYAFGLSVFIDSCVWGYADDLLKKIDDKFCRNPDGSTYSYEKRNNSTSHVHMMLSTALIMMMDKTECIVFLNTPNSIDSTDIINRTKSPWIYYEIGVTRSVRRKIPERPTGIIKKGLFENAQALTIKYKVDLNHLREIKQSDLEYWERDYIRNKEMHPLDLLYGKHNLIEYLR
ncbi:toll/interleukin-1 receptor domain-containing protein [Paenibacillus physcomitrellae]|uniref:TIR domain-containing protein n=1 Tax=Paenibacillus physcomitrellae TaxID=1619311 RepID=A0ABQ1G0I6_9BACL|nr:toll/interleukin-1 receptor domain-containing protein [Paenibacillus physcomitrellae]GGA34482.1 hypothetical protein GCM10010917_19690 [Paenibacillus physcomitrellae]